MSGNRREFFKRTSLLATAAVGFPHVVRSAEEQASGADARPRHIIHLVSDGTSMGTLTLADHFSRLQRPHGLRWLELYQRPGACAALVNMRSLNSLVTDSSAASSSWGSGSRVVNGVLNQLPDGRELRPLYALFDELHWKRALVTTTEITHATPAGFVANCSSRGSAEDIARQYLARRVDILLGGGRKFFDPAQRKDKQDLRAEFRAAGYAVMERAAELEAAPRAQRWLGTFASSHLPFTIDHLGDRALLTKVPTLARMTELALHKLAGEDHFILQVEGGRVDHAAHACDISAAVRDAVAFDEAIEVVLEFQRRVPETLLVITTDHGTGNPGLNGTGTAYKESSPLFANTLKVRRSFESLENEWKKSPTVAGVQKLILSATGYQASDARAAMLLTFLEKKGKALYEQMNSATVQFGQLLGNYLGVGWSSSAHTADYVPLLALGPGAERFRGFLQNTDVFRNYLDLARMDYRNPEMPLLAETSPSAAEVEGTDRLV